jgi:RNA polymerase sigma-70 factor (ECF subfamily)
MRTDADLLGAHLAGDRHAFAELYQRHRVRLHRFARVRSRTAQDAEDAVQDAMLAAHRNAGSFRHDCSVGSWLHRIVNNACLDRRRRDRCPTIEVTENCAVMTDLSERLDTSVVLHRALARLPPAQRAAVIAVDMLGYSVAEAARLLGAAEGTVKSRRARARAQLAVLIGAA